MKNTKQKITNIIWKRIANRLFKKKRDENNEKNPLKSSKKNCVSRIKQAMIINKYNHK